MNTLSALLRTTLVLAAAAASVTTAVAQDYLNSRESRKFLDEEHEQLRRILSDLGLAK